MGTSSGLAYGYTAFNGCSNYWTSSRSWTPSHTTSATRFCAGLSGASACGGSTASVRLANDRPTSSWFSFRSGNGSCRSCLAPSR